MSLLKPYDEMTADQKLAYKMGREAERARWDDPDEVRAAVVPLLDLEAAAEGFYDYDDTYPERWDYQTEDVKDWYRKMTRIAVYAALGLGEES